MKGRFFPSRCANRQLVLGTAGPAEYFWMDGRQLRQGRGGPNFRACVDLWWNAVEAAGEARLQDNEVSLVLAECYPLINTARAVQDVYVDAHLHRTADREYVIEEEEGVRRARSDRTYVLPEEECERLREVAHTRDTNQVRAELESLFLGELPPRREMPAYQEAARAWIGNGIRALRTEGREGLRRYTGTVDEWIRRLRRRGNLDRGRHVSQYVLLRVQGRLPYVLLQCLDRYPSMARTKSGAKCAGRAVHATLAPPKPGSR